MNHIVIAIFLITIAHSLSWLLYNGQFVWPFFKKNPLLISFIFGIAISYILIHSTKHMVNHFNGLLWPGRFIGFSVGIVIFTIFTYVFANEGITLKTFVSLLLAITLICIQIFWKN